MVEAAKLLDAKFRPMLRRLLQVRVVAVEGLLNMSPSCMCVLLLV